MKMSMIFYFLIPFIITYFSTLFFRKLALRFKILDIPGGRKIHKTAMPLLGGAAVYLGLLSGLMLNLEHLNFFLPVLIGSTMIMILGLVDDIRKLTPGFRLFFQFLAAMIVIMFGVRISFLPATLWGDISEVIVTLIWIVGITNAFNCLDGMDGLATGLAIISSLCFFFLAVQTKQTQGALICLILIGSCLGFLRFNFNPAKIFLGDAGSNFLGFILACLAIMVTWAEDNVVNLSIPLFILGVPIFDMVFTTIMRIKEDKIHNVIEWMAYTDKDHFHHRLADLGFGFRGTVIFIYFVSIVAGLNALVLYEAHNRDAVLLLIQAIVGLMLMSVLMIIGKRHSMERN